MQFIAMQKIAPCLWFDNNAQEAVKFYTSIFKNSKILNTTKYDEEGAKVSGQPKGSVMSISFTLDGQEFMALNGGPIFKFNEAISLMVKCKDQKEIDYFWDKLTRGGQEVQCGWLKDKFGLSWQIVPSVMDDMMKDPKKAKNVMKAILGMIKIDIKTLEKAYSQK